MAYTTIDNPELFFQTKLYTGNATDNTAITLDGDENMQPDWVWIKDRTNGNHHRIYDSVRGATKVIYSSLTNAEGTASTGLKSFDSDGFTLGTGSDENGNSANLVAWNWKAGTSFSNDASATGVGDIDSSGSVNTDAGFSIIGYNGNNASSAGVAHGLGTTPSMIIQKRRVDSIASWRVWHNKIHATSGETKTLLLNTTAANASDNDNISGVSSTTFTVRGAGGATNPNGSSCITYCFAEKQGYSKFGSYTGNGNSDGTFVYTGFKPAFVMTKKTSSSTARNWCILDNKRSSSGANVVDDRLFPNLGDAEDSSTSADFLSNGFKLRDNAGEFNQAVSYIYMAFAESPFTNSNGVPTNAK
jgi:hypothetical protein